MTVILRDRSIVDDHRLDRIVSETTEHLDKYPLTAATLPSKATPVVAGVNWYTTGDRPVLRKIRGVNRYVIGDGDPGRIRGGHAVCFRPWTVTDSATWWDHYDQGSEGRCVEFAWLRALSLLNRKQYDITSRWHYWQMQFGDEFPGGSFPGSAPVEEGTSVRAGGVVMQTFGAIPAAPRGAAVPAGFVGGEESSFARPSEGIAAYRWATNWQDVRTVLGVPDWLPGVPLLNSWARDYPHEVILLDTFGERLLREDGELAVATDR